MRLVKIDRNNINVVFVKGYFEGQLFSTAIIEDKNTGIELPSTYMVRGKQPWVFDWGRNIDSFERNDFYYIFGGGILYAMFSVFFYRNNTGGSKDLAFLSLFEINPSCRRQGFGTKCLAMLEEYLHKNEGINHISLEPLGSKEVHKFYSSCGYIWDRCDARFNKALKST